MPPETKKRAWQAAQKVPLARLNVISAMFQAVSWRFDRFWNEISPPCIVLRQTSDPCPGLAIRFPVPYTLLMGVPYLPWRNPRSAPIKNGGRSMSLFSFLYPDFRTAVPALDKIIGIPILRRDNELGLDSRSCVHQSPPALGA